jgi:hypothetical protein
MKLKVARKVLARMIVLQIPFNQNGQNIPVSKAANQSLFGKQNTKKTDSNYQPKRINSRRYG